MRTSTHVALRAARKILDFSYAFCVIMVGYVGVCLVFGTLVAAFLAAFLAKWARNNALIQLFEPWGDLALFTLLFSFGLAGLFWGWDTFTRFVSAQLAPPDLDSERDV